MIVWWWVGCGHDPSETTLPVERDLAGPLLGRGVAVRDGALWVSAPDTDEGGAVYQLAALSGSEVSLASASLRVDALAPGDVGDSFALCDLDADGQDDLVVGAPGHGSSGGAFWLLGGAGRALSDATFVAGLRTEGRAGTTVACGDVDGDGRVDVVTSAPESAGLDIVTGPGTVEVHTWDVDHVAKIANLETTRSNSHLGYRTGLLTGHDFDGDGLDDLVVGAYGASRVYYVDAPFEGSFDTNYAGVAWVGEDDEGAGYSFAAGDLDGDGYEDLLVGAPLAIASQGAVLVALHPAADDGGKLSAISSRLTGPGLGDQAGFSLAVVGDADGDGADDWLAGTPTAGGVGANAGAAYLVLGDGAGVGDLDNSDLAVIGDVPESYLGWSVAGGDLDGDGAPELVVGAPEEDVGGVVGAGAVYVFDGALSGRLDRGAAAVRVVP